MVETGEMMRSTEHESMDLLLPWFVNRTLEPHEHERVRRHLDACEECRDAVSLLSTVESTLRHPTATPMVPPPRTDRLLQAVDRAGGRGRRRPLTFALAASLAAVVLAAALLLPDRERSQTGPVRYETATSTAPAAPMDYVLDLRFELDTPVAARERVLRDLDARDVSASEPGGAYRITVRLPAASLEELEGYVRELEALPGVASAKVVALQLPVTRPQ